MRPEITYADGTDPPRLNKLFHGAPAFGVGGSPAVAESDRIGPMDQKQIEIIQSQLIHGLFKGTHHEFIGVVGVFQLSRDKQFRARNTAEPDGFADALLVAVALRGIDMRVSRVKGASNGLYGRFAVRRLPGAEPDAGNPDAV